jgi:hypothetical protein
LPPGDAPPVGPLSRALRDERTVVADLEAALTRQRHALIADDADAVRDSVFAAHRLLAAYREARSRRRNAVLLASRGGADLVEALALCATPQVSEDARTESEALVSAGRRALESIATNLRLLRPSPTAEGARRPASEGGAEPLPPPPALAS